MFVPAFAIINSKNISFTGWNIKYSGYFIATPNYGFYYENGTANYFISSQIMTQAYKSNDVVLKNYLTSMRNVKFVGTNPTWIGPSNSGTIFNIRGSSQYLNFTNFYMFANKNSHGSDFIPFAFSFTSGLRSNQTVTSATTSNITSENFAVPSDLNFYNFTFDGVVMAFQGNLQRANFNPIDMKIFKILLGIVLELLENVSDVVDYGQRVGLARDKNFGDTVSGDARSLKIGGHNVIVDNYVSYRADGFLDLLSSNNIILRNIRGTVDFSFQNFELIPVRFPQKYYRNILIDGMEITDLAKVTSLKTMGTFPYSVTSYNCILRNVRFNLNIYTGTEKSLTTWGLGNNMRLQYSYNFINPSSNNRVVLNYSYP